MNEIKVTIRGTPTILEEMRRSRPQNPDRADASQSLVSYIIPQPSKEVELLNHRIEKSIEVGDLQGVIELAATYGMPLRSDYLKVALKKGKLEIVKYLVGEGLSTDTALHDCISAPRENIEILRFLLQAKAKLDYPDIRLAVCAGYLDSARLLINYDTSGQYLRITAEDIGGSRESAQAVKHLCALVGPERHRDILEYALQGAVRKNNHEAIADLFEMGAKGDRVVWRWGASFEAAEQLKALCLTNGVPLPLPHRFPIAQDDGDHIELLERVAGQMKNARPAVPESDVPLSRMSAMREAYQALQAVLSCNIISQPLLNAIPFPMLLELVDACKRSDGDDLRAIVSKRPDILDPSLYLLEQVVGSGSLPAVKILIEELGADLHQHEEMPLAMAAHEGYVDVLEYLIARGAKINGYQGAALSEAARMSNAEVVKALLKHGADPRAHRSKAVYECARQQNNVKHTAALRAAKFLVDAGASPQLLSPSSPYDVGPATQYVRFMMEIRNPQSPLYLKTLETRLTDAHINFSMPSHSSTPVFGFASSCAVVAARLFASPESPKIFVSLFKNGMSKVLDEKIGTFANLRTSANVDIDLFQDVHDVAAGALWDVIIPTLVSRREMLPDNFEGEIIKRANSLAYTVAEELFADYSVNEILKFSQIWHRPDKQLPLDAKPLRSIAHWYPLIPRVDLGDGFTIEALTTNDELVLEGSILHHCLRNGGYGAACMQGGAHILSIRKDGIPQATLEMGDISPRPGVFSLPSRRSLAVMQIRGDGNAQIDFEVEQRFERFASMVHRGDVRLWDGAWGETDVSRAARTKAGVSLLEGMTGIRNGEYPERAAEHYRSVLSVPATQRGASGRPPKIGLLEPHVTERIIAACRAVLAGPPDRLPDKGREPDLSSVRLKRLPSKARVLAWAIQARCEDFYPHLRGEGFKGIFYPSQTWYSRQLAELALPKDGPASYRADGLKKDFRHAFFE